LSADFSGELSYTGTPAVRHKNVSARIRSSFQFTAAAAAAVSTTTRGIIADRDYSITAINPRPA